MWFHYMRICSKSEGSVANSEDPDQTSLKSSQQISTEILFFNVHHVLKLIEGGENFYEF